MRFFKLFIVVISLLCFSTNALLSKKFSFCYKKHNFTDIVHLDHSNHEPCHNESKEKNIQCIECDCHLTQVQASLSANDLVVLLSKLNMYEFINFRNYTLQNLQEPPPKKKL